MAEYLIKDASLTSIADKIRVLSGTTGTMSLDTMKTHVDDANNEVNIQTDLLAQVTTALEGDAAGSYLAPIVDALTDKGIEVPSGMNVDGLAALIAAIEAGGGGVSTGTITPSNYTQSITIGAAIPEGDFVFVILAESALKTNSKVYIRYTYLIEVNGVLSGVSGGGSNYVTNIPNGSVFKVTVDRNTNTISYDSAISSDAEYFDGGITFRWFIGGLV